MSIWLFGVVNNQQYTAVCLLACLLSFLLCKRLKSRPKVPGNCVFVLETARLTVGLIEIANPNLHLNPSSNPKSNHNLTLTFALSLSLTQTKTIQARESSSLIKCSNNTTGQTSNSYRQTEE